MWCKCVIHRQFNLRHPVRGHLWPRTPLNICHFLENAYFYMKLHEFVGIFLFFKMIYRPLHSIKNWNRYVINSSGSFLTPKQLLQRRWDRSVYLIASWQFFYFKFTPHFSEYKTLQKVVQLIIISTNIFIINEKLPC